MYAVNVLHVVLVITSYHVHILTQPVLQKGTTPFLEVCTKDCHHSVALFLQHGADPNTVSSEVKYCMFATKFNDLEVFHTNVQKTEYNALYWSSKIGAYAISKVLLDAGINPHHMIKVRIHLSTSLVLCIQFHSTIKQSPLLERTHCCKYYN